MTGFKNDQKKRTFYFIWRRHTMAVIREYRKKDGSKWYYFKAYIGIDPLTGKEKNTTRRGFKTKKEARQAAALLEMEIAKKGLPTAKKNVLFEEIFLDWFDQYKNTVKPSTAYTQLNMINKHILPNFTGLRMDKITTAYCQKQVNKWFESYKKYHNLVGVLRRIFKYAKLTKQIDYDPMDAVITPNKKSRQELWDDYTAPFYTKEQLLTFLSELKKTNNDLAYTLFRLLAFTGLRKGELLALMWSDIDLQQRTLTVSKTLAKSTDGKEKISTPKTKNSNRTIALDDNTISILKKWKKKQSEKIENVLSDDEQPIFTMLDNSILYLDYPNNFLKTFLKKTGLPHITIHGFRHTHASLLFEAGVSIKEAQARLGHKNIKTTMDIYTHVTNETREKTADKFSQFMDF